VERAGGGFACAGGATAPDTGATPERAPRARACASVRRSYPVRVRPELNRTRPFRASHSRRERCWRKVQEGRRASARPHARTRSPAREPPATSSSSAGGPTEADPERGSRSPHRHEIAAS
jgi:hypothetical protein